MAKKVKDLTYYEAVGRRKESVARVRLYIGGKSKSVTIKGDELALGSKIINKKKYDEYFSSEAEKKVFLKPLELTQNVDRFAISVMVSGGGKNSQLEAVVHGISRALVLSNEEYRPILKEQDLLTRDPRAKERRKVGTGGKARRKKQSPKR